MSRLCDTVALLRGVQSVIEAGAKLSENELKAIWRHSSVKGAVFEASNKLPVSNLDFNDFVGRISTIFYGIKAFTEFNPHDHTKEEKQGKDEKQGKEEVGAKKVVEKAPIKPFEIELSQSDRQLLRKLDREHRDRMAKQFSKKQDDKEDISTHSMATTSTTIPSVKTQIEVLPNSKQNLSSSAKQRTVPSTRIGRMASFGSLAAGLGIGTIAEYTKRTLGLVQTDKEGNVFMNKANMERIVDTLCKVRGAALKIGQILSIQDESVINPELALALERVRKSADFMPLWQLEKAMTEELGANWRKKFAEFDTTPFAAASIGQVHWGKTHDGIAVAVKVQYPGVAKGIESDIDNLIGIMKVWNLFPPGMFVDNLVIVAKRELAWEVDYVREAECTKRFKRLVEPYPYYYVPDVIDNLSTKQIFTTEFVDGVPVDQCLHLPQEDRNYIGTKILELVLREVMEFQYMQTDPNWANFFYNANTKKVLLLDFGASRAYTKRFLDNYVRIIKAASEADRKSVLTYSNEMGFFTGYESKIMQDAHIDAVMILGEVFRQDAFDFSKQNTTARLQDIVPTMLAHRLCPPPEEIYSLNRKISGVFLLAAKLKAIVPAKSLFNQLVDNYKFDY